jgi:hypothetical protein
MLQYQIRLSMLYVSTDLLEISYDHRSLQDHPGSYELMGGPKESANSPVVDIMSE